MGFLFSKKIYIFEINERQSTSIQRKYAKEIESLENLVHKELEKKGKGYIFFTTGFEDIFSYIKDKDVTVMECQDNDYNIISASYITQGQGLYTYNDLSKYFKYNDEYVEYAKSKYNPKELCSIEYDTFMKKIKGYKYAKELIAIELNITDLVGHCKSEKEKGTFDEKNQVREKVNRYIYDYFRDNPDGQHRIGFAELDRFYLLKFSDLQNCEDIEIRNKCENETEENIELYKEYGELIDLFNLKDSILPDEKDFTYLKRENYKKYFDANPFNTVELDTYMVHPNHRRKGLATIVTLEGLKIQIGKLLKKRPYLDKIFISATIHQDNIPSKRVTEGLGDFDILYVKRRTGINREVYFCKIEREKLDEFMRSTQRKIIEKKNRVEAETGLVFRTTEL